jgi:hypothetical protein
LYANACPLLFAYSGRKQLCLGAVIKSGPGLGFVLQYYVMVSTHASPSSRESARI